MAGRLRFSGPKTYNPQLARATANTNRISRAEQLRRELGIGDDDDVSDDGSMSGSDRESGGERVSSAEVGRLQAEVESLRQQARQAAQEADARVSGMQWKLRTATLRAKKKEQAADDLFTEMIDTMYDLENAVKDAGGTVEQSWSEHYDEKRGQLATARGGSPVKQSRSGAENPETKDGADSAVDAVELLALKKENKRLRAALDAARAVDNPETSAVPAPAPAPSPAPAPAPAPAEDGTSAARVAELTESLQQAEEQVAALQTRVDELSSALEQARAAAAAGADADEARQLQHRQATAAASAAAQAKIKALEQANQSLRADLKQAQQTVDAAAARADESSSSSSALQDELSVARAQAAEAESKLAAAQEHVAELQRAKEAATAAMTAAGSDKDRLHQERVAELEARVAEQSAARKEAEDANQANIAAAQQALGTWKEKYTQVKTERKQYKHQLQAAAVDLRSMQERLAAAEAKASESGKRVADLESQASDLAAKNDSAAGSVTSLQAQLQAQQSELAALKQQVQESHATIGEVRAARDALAADKDRLETKVAEASAAASTSEAQVQAMVKQHEEERQQIITILKTKYTKRIDKWKSRAASGTVVIRQHRQFAGDMRQLVADLRTSVADGFGGLQHLMKRRCRSLAKASVRQSEAMDGLRDKYRKESKRRKQLFNDLMELRGNIRVFARVRPVVAKEDKAGSEVAVSFPTEDSIALVNSKRHRKEWQFDHVFQPGTTNTQVFEQCRDLLTSVVDGYNVCIFAYGQTGAGKTHTMEGRPENPGLNARTLRLLFDLSRERAEEWKFEIEISLLEIYNETIADLLATEPLTKKLAVKRSEHGNFVPGLTRRQVTSSEQVLDIMRRGYKTRTTFATDSNEHSSRSHCMLSVYVVASNKLTNMVARGKLHLVDLAGSERVSKSGVTGARLKEAQAINKSLAALGNVIASRASKNSHVPFRDSVLTYLLEDSLSKQSKTLMFVNMSPVAANADESFCSLNFAARVRTVELGKASKNVSAGRGAGAGSRSRAGSRSSRK